MHEKLAQMSEQELLKKAQTSVCKAAKKARIDPYRPIFHAICPANWMNDPNGPIAINNEIHLFYQHFPFEARGAQPMFWGHMVTKNMVEWSHLPIAFGPSNEKNDTSCWSGCCVVDSQNKPAILYTSVPSDPKQYGTAAQVWLVEGSPDMLNWKKYPKNPVMTQITHNGGLAIKEWRDPFAWKEQDGYYYCVMGGQLLQPKMEAKYQVNPMVTLYRSKDLHTWEFCHPLLARYQGKLGEATQEVVVEEHLNLGGDYECPLFFPLNESRSNYCAVVSTVRVSYALGTFKNTEFKPMMWHALDYGSTFYAPHSFLDHQGRRILIGWARVNHMPLWNGCFTLPRILTEGSNGTLKIEPIPELTQLRQQKIALENVTIESGHKYVLLDPQKLPKEFFAGLANGAIELRLEIALLTKGEIPNFDLQYYPNGNPEKEFLQTLTYDNEEQLFYIGNQNGVFHRLPEESTINIVIYLDRVLGEIYINKRWCLTHEIAFVPGKLAQFVLCAKAEALTIVKGEAYILKSINM